MCTSKFYSSMFKLTFRLIPITQKKCFLCMSNLSFITTQHITKFSVRSATMQTPTENTSFKNLAKNILRGQACRLFRKRVPSAHISRASSRLSLCACAVTSSINWEATDAISWNSCYVYVCSCALNMFNTTEGAADCEIRSVICFLDAKNVLPSQIHHQICQM